MRWPGTWLIVGRGSWLLAAAMAASVTNAPPAQGGIRVDQRDPYFTLASEQLIGNQGEERIDVSVSFACGEQAWVFDHAELQIMRSRFSSAQLVAMPQAGCIDCEPLRLRWYHEPTGHLTLAVRVYRRLIDVSCEASATDAP